MLRPIYGSVDGGLDGVGVCDVCFEEFDSVAAELVDDGVGVGFVEVEDGDVSAGAVELFGGSTAEA